MTLDVINSRVWRFVLSKRVPSE